METSNDGCECVVRIPNHLHPLFAEADHLWAGTLQTTLLNLPTTLGQILEQKPHD